MSTSRWKTILSAAALSLIVGRLGLAATFYVDPVNGNDTTGTGSQAQPVKTVLKAGQLLTAQPGQAHTVILRGSPTTGHYPFSTFDPTNYMGSASFPITVQSFAGETAIFDFGYNGDTTATSTDATLVNGTVTDPFKSNPAGSWVNAQTGDAGLGIPADPNAAPGEYVSVKTYPSAGNDRFMMGMFLASATGLGGDKLLTYSKLDDLRGGIGGSQSTQNESGVVVPLADSRNAGGPLQSDATKKQPWCYRGPGIWWDPNPSATDKRIHIRLASTHLNTSGVTDYVSTPNANTPTDPRTIPISIAGSLRTAAAVQGSYITFQNIVFQNGGRRVVVIEQTGGVGIRANNITFDHCTFKGGRFVVQSAKTKFLKFQHSVFNAALPSYCTREDTKSDYTYMVGGNPVLNELCKVTNDILLQVDPLDEDMEVANCEFRNSHDAMQAYGIRPRIHHCLFENINDDVIYDEGVAVQDVRIYSNVMRKIMEPWSKNSGNGTFIGERYYYRNIIDMRMPTLGLRVLPPDPAPTNGPPFDRFWRIESDFKTKSPVNNQHYYHNTLVQGYTEFPQASSYFGDMTAGKTRNYLNNIHMTIGNDRSFHKIPNPAVGTPFSNGNVWHRRSTTAIMPHYIDYNGVTYANHAALVGTTIWNAYVAANGVGWDTNSLFVYPLFSNVPDFTNFFAEPFSNVDFRLKTGSPAIGTGVNLIPKGWPDDPAYSADSTPDIGALPFGASALAVGVNGQHVFPDGVTPVAEAGDYLTVADASDNGFETISFNGNGSSDPNGTINSYAWTLNGSQIATGVNPSVGLPVGTHKVFLTVTDNDSPTPRTAKDMREVTITGFDNIVKNPGFENGSTDWTLVSGCTIVAAQKHLGNQALQLVAGATERINWQPVPITPGQAVNVSGWAKKGTAGGISFRLKWDWLDSAGAVIAGMGGTIGTTTSTSWTLLSGTTNVAPANAVSVKVKACLDAGSHTAWFDDCNVLVINKVKNAHFERGMQNWVLTGAGQAAGSLTTNPADVRSGTTSAVVTNPTGTCIFRSDVFAVNASTPYLISAWSKGVSSTVGAQLRIQWLTSTGASAGNLPVGSAWPTGSYGYAQRLASLTSPSNAASAQVEIHRGSGTGTVFYDDVLVK